MFSRREVLACAVAVGLYPRLAQAQSNELVLDVRFPSDRRQTGLLTLKRADGSPILSDLKALGKADNGQATRKGNRERDPTRPYGDTPTGRYSVPRAVATGTGTHYASRTYGPHGALVLAPVEGQALEAKANGRIGLLIHGGAPGSNNRLRATHGCIRLSDEDMARLMEAIRSAGNNPVFRRCEIVQLSVLVGELSVDEPGSDESDPPPGIRQLLDPGPIELPRP